MPVTVRYGANSWLGLALALLTAFGCSRSGPRVIEVRGMVTYQGKPVTQGAVLFIPVTIGQELSRPATGVISADGSFQMKAFPDRPGVLPGEYQVGIEAYTGSYLEGNVAYLVPKRFARPASSGLTTKLSADEESPIEMNFDLHD